tara:strand:- start:733 stop:1467 length:735 start_codon:yes stop_codon:yes gene_type:complete
MLDEYDKNKFVVIVCAGPTARRVQKSDQYYTCGVNVTPLLIEETDFWVCNDGCYLDDLNADTLKNIKNLAIPQYPHTVNGENYQPDAVRDYIYVTRQLPKHIKVHPFNIQSAARFGLLADPDYPLFEVKSSSEAALKWLLHVGFTKFISVGHDPAGGYHPKMWSRPTRGGGAEIVSDPIDNPRYRNVHERMRKVIDDSGCTFIRFVLPSGKLFGTEKPVCDATVSYLMEQHNGDTGYQEIIVHG